jgi:hypothetical protein
MAMSRDSFIKFKDAVNESHKGLRPFRDGQREAMMQYLGPHYGDRTKSQSVPVNMLEMAVTTYVQQLAARAPQVLVNTHKRELRASAKEFELAINESLKRMDFESELQLWVMSALFSIGIMKIGTYSSGFHEIDDETFANTQVFAEAIMLDDWVHDVRAKRWGREVSFCGHRYKMKIADVEANPYFDQEMVAKLSTSLREERIGEERIEDLSGEKSVDDADFDPSVELWDIWIPRDNVVVTFSETQSKPLREQEWTGPDHGPYRLLGFNRVLNNIMPLPPVANWIDSHDLFNLLYTKLGEQASRQKTVTFATPMGKDDARTVISANDGETVMVQNPNSVKEAKYGGVDQATLAFALNMRGVNSYIMGNLDALTGGSTTADTLGQEKIIKESSSDRLKQMQGGVSSAIKKVVADIAFWLFHDPMLEMDLTQKIPGTDVELDTKWPFQQDEFGVEIDAREGEFDQYDFDIEPFSMQDLSPGERLQLLRQVFTQDIMPLTQFGVQPDVNAYLALVAKYSNMPELADIVPAISTFGDASIQGQPGKSPTSSREYVRRSVSAGRTQQADDQQMTQQLMAAASAG